MIVKHVGSLPSTRIYYNLGSIILFLLIVWYCSFPILPIEEPRTHLLRYTVYVYHVSYGILYSYTGYRYGFSHSPSDQAVLTFTFLASLDFVLYSNFFIWGTPVCDYY
jgi:hypothetical protein